MQRFQASKEVNHEHHEEAPNGSGQQRLEEDPQVLRAEASRYMQFFLPQITPDHVSFAKYVKTLFGRPAWLLQDIS